MAKNKGAATVGSKVKTEAGEGLIVSIDEKKGTVVVGIEFKTKEVKLLTEDSGSEEASSSEESSEESGSASESGSEEDSGSEEASSSEESSEESSD